METRDKKGNLEGKATSAEDSPDWRSLADGLMRLVYSAGKAAALILPNLHHPENTPGYLVAATLVSTEAELCSLIGKTSVYYMPNGRSEISYPLAFSPIEVQLLSWAYHLIKK